MDWIEHNVICPLLHNKISKMKTLLTKIILYIHQLETKKIDVAVVDCNKVFIRAKINHDVNIDKFDEELAHLGKFQVTLYFLRHDMMYEHVLSYHSRKGITKCNSFRKFPDLCENEVVIKIIPRDIDKVFYFHRIKDSIIDNDILKYLFESLDIELHEGYSFCNLEMFNHEKLTCVCQNQPVDYLNCPDCPKPEEHDYDPAYHDPVYDPTCHDPTCPDPACPDPTCYDPDKPECNPDIIPTCDDYQFCS